jgi:protein gp37
MQYKRGITQYRDNFELTLSPSRLTDPLGWKKPQLVFVNSMSDLFHEGVPDSYISAVFKIMNQATIHTFQVLTKRIERVRSLTGQLNWSENIWLGVSVESSEFINRIDQLKQAPSKTKFISFEPLIAPITYPDYEGIDWVLVGGESGGGARKMKKEWVVSIQKNCQRSNVPFFFKQWGKRQFNPNIYDPSTHKDHPFYAKGGCMIDNEVYRAYPIITNGITDQY